MADTKLTELDAITLPAAADIYVTVDDVGSTPITKKITHDDVLFGANTTPSTQAHGDAAAVGNALDAARANHKHAMPAASGEAKLWCRITTAGALESPDFNISSVDDDNTGDRTINFSLAFSTSVYSAPSGLACDCDDVSEIGMHTFATGSVDLDTWNNGSKGDKATSTSGFGDQ